MKANVTEPKGGPASEHVILDSDGHDRKTCYSDQYLFTLTPWDSNQGPLVPKAAGS